MDAKWTRLPFRICVTALLFSAVWICVGSIWFPLWWYRAIWESDLVNSDYLSSAWLFLLNEHPGFLLGIAAAILALTFSYRLWSRTFPLLNRFALQIIVVSLIAASIDAGILYKTQRPLAVAYDTIGKLANTLLETVLSLAAGGATTPTRIDGPVSFYYLDGAQVTALYSQIEPTLIEKERTISTDAKAAASATLKTPSVEMKAERSTGASQTSAFKSNDFSADRKCLELINITIGQGRVSYYATAEAWKGLEFKKYITGVIKAYQQSAAYRFGHIPKTDLDAIKSQSAAFAKQLDSTMISELARAHGFILIDGLFHRRSNVDGCAYYTEEFAAKPRMVSFRFPVPKWTNPRAMTDTMSLRVYGNITHQLGDTNYIEISPVAIF